MSIIIHAGFIGLSLLLAGILFYLILETSKEMEALERELEEFHKERKETLEKKR